jgi:hypothetical protein
MISTAPQTWPSDRSSYSDPPARVRTNRTALRCDPVKWQAAIEANLAQAHGPDGAEPTLYEGSLLGAEV